MEEILYLVLVEQGGEHSPLLVEQEAIMVVAVVQQMVQAILAVQVL